MELLIYDTELELIEILDVFKSLIWTDRFYEPGDFEITVPYTEHYASIFKMDYYLSIKASDKMMIIETIEIISDIEDGDEMLISGRSLESILDRRCVWDKTILSGDLQSEVLRLLSENIISPAIPQRKLSNLKAITSSENGLKSKTVNREYYGENLLDVLTDICRDHKIGMKISLDLDTKIFTFELYTGTDRSYNQETNPYLIFSPKYDNLINCEWIRSKKSYKNVTKVIGEELESGTKTLIVGDNNLSGLDRREMYTSAQDISSENANGVTLSDSEYYALLKERGNKELSEYNTTEVVDGDLVADFLEYRKDYYLGDTVWVIERLGFVDAEARITEMIFSYDKSGHSIYPTFEIV